MSDTGMPVQSPAPAVLKRLLVNEASPGPLAFLLLSLVFVCLAVSAVHPQYIENDDVTILDFAARGFMVPYAGVLFTGFLHLLYTTAPGVPWYPLGLYALHLLALSLWLALVWRVFRPAWLALLFTALLLGSYLVFLAYLNYTSTSAMLCMAAVTSACLDAAERRAGFRRYALYGIVLMLGMLARPQGAMGALVYMLPYGLLTAILCLRGQTWATEVRRLLFIALVFFVPASLNTVADGVLRHYAATPEQQRYDAFNGPRGRLDRLGGAAKQAILSDKALLASVHWTRLQAADFFDWNFFDERVYTPEAVQTLLQQAPHYTLTTDWFYMIAVERLPQRVPLLVLLAASLALFLPLLRRRPLEGIIGMLAPVWCAGLTTWMYLFYSYTYRVELPFETGFALAGLMIGGALLSREVASGTRTWRAALVGCAGIAFTGLALLLHVEYLNHRKAVGGCIQFQQELRVLNRDYADSIILLQPKFGLQFEKSNPLKPEHLNFKVIQLGWSTFSPRFYQQLAPLGITHGYELVDALAASDKAYVLCSPGWCKGLLRRAADPGRVKLEFVRPIRSRVGLYRLEQTAK